MSGSDGDAAQFSLTRLGLWACLGVAVILRTAALSTDFWLDEVWSLQLSARATSFLEVFSRIPVDNNHPLNTWWMVLLGEREDWRVYRIPSLVTGIALVFLLALLARPAGRWAALAVGWLAAISYPLVLYASEARGYSMAACFSALAWLALGRWWETQRRTWLGAYWIASAVAVLAHFSSVMVLMGLGAWSLRRAVKSSAEPAVVVPRLVREQGPAWLPAVILYAAFIRGMVIGGGERNSVIDVVVSALSLAMGAPDTHPWTWFGAAITVFLAALGLIRLMRRADDVWVFHVTALVVAPAFILVVQQPEQLYFRYFVVLYGPLYVLMGHGLAMLWDRARPLVPCVLLASTAGHLALAACLATEGRGHYLEALEQMAAESPGRTVVLTGDHPFRNDVMLKFYAPRVANATVVYVNTKDIHAASPDWYLLQSGHPHVEPPPEILDGAGRPYALVRRYGHCGHSGLVWSIYRRLGH